jgi:Putative GTP-binding controlling metal-binding
LRGIDAEEIVETGLGLAIMDRLRKASARPGLPLNHAET